MSTVKKTQRRVATPMCKVCIDAGKSEKIFTSHFTKNRDGKVCCPTLLSQKCRRCEKSGHTVKYCTVDKSSKTGYSTPPRLSSSRSPPRAPKKVGFAVLDESDDEKENDDEAYFATPTSRTWASVAATAPIPAVETSHSHSHSMINIVKPVNIPVFYKINIINSWADYVDSSDEEDNNDE